MISLKILFLTAFFLASNESTAWGQGACSKSSIEVVQAASTPLPSGIPTYAVEITNADPHGLNISDIHLHCGAFASAKLINPKVFRRLSYDDCLVNDGNILQNGQALSFQYANSFSYTLSVASIHC